MSQQKTLNQHKSLTLRKLLAQCLQRKGTVFSAESLFLEGKQKRLPDLMRDASETEFILDEIFGERFERLVTDIADYGRRREYEFEGPSETPADRMAQRWLNGDISDLDVKVGRGKRSEPHVVDGHRLSFGECLARLVTEAAERDFSRDTLWWLSWHMDYSLDWLLFGVGTIAKSSFHNTCDPSTAPLDPSLLAGNDGSFDDTLEQMVASIQTVSEIKAMRGTTTWRGADWNWLMNGKTHTTHVCRAPTLPLCARCVSAWNIQPVMPEMPDLLAFIDWLYVYILREFFVVEPLAKGDWRQQLFATIARGKNKVLILLGTTPQAGTQYRLGKATPGNAVVKLAYFIEFIVRRFGRIGFLQYLAMVNEEAHARGFSSLLEVMERRSWRDDKSGNDEDEDFDSEDFEDEDEDDGEEVADGSTKASTPAKATSARKAQTRKASEEASGEAPEQALGEASEGEAADKDAKPAKKRTRKAKASPDAPCEPDAPGAAESAGAPSENSGKASDAEKGAKTAKNAKTTKTAKNAMSAKNAKAAKDAKATKDAKAVPAEDDAGKNAKDVVVRRKAKPADAASAATGQPEGQPEDQPEARPASLPEAQPEGQPASQSEAQSESQPEAQSESQSEAQPASLPEAQPESQPEAQPASLPEAQLESQPASLPEAQSESQPEAQSEAQPESQPEAQPEGQPEGLAEELTGEQPEELAEDLAESLSEDLLSAPGTTEEAGENADQNLQSSAKRRRPAVAAGFLRRRGKPRG